MLSNCTHSATVGVKGLKSVCTRNAPVRATSANRVFIRSLQSVH